MFGGSVENYIAARNEWDLKLQGGSVIHMFPVDSMKPFTPALPNCSSSS